jgi:hypothetical protein
MCKGPWSKEYPEIRHAHSMAITSVLMDTNINFVYSAGADNTVKAWRVHPENCTECLKSSEKGTVSLPVYVWSNVHKSKVTHILFADYACESIYTSGDDSHIN